MRLSPLAALALALLASFASAAPDIGAPGDDELFLSSAPASQAVDAEGAGVRATAPEKKVSTGAPSRKAQQPGRAGIVDVQLDKPQDIGKEAYAAKPTLTEASAPQGKPPIVFQHYKEAPQSTVAIYHKHLPFDGGPGTTYSIGFEAMHGDGGFLWCEGERNTFGCNFRAWFSLTPGGPAIVDNFPKAHNFCKVDDTNVYGNAWWATAAPEQKNVGSCHLKDGQRYYFNMQLVDWQPSPVDSKVFACDEYLDLAGDSTGDLWKQ